MSLTSKLKNFFRRKDVAQPAPPPSIYIHTSRDQLRSDVAESDPLDEPLRETLRDLFGTDAKHISNPRPSMAAPRAASSVGGPIDRPRSARVGGVIDHPRPASSTPRYSAPRPVAAQPTPDHSSSALLYGLHASSGSNHSVSDYSPSSSSSSHCSPSSDSSSSYSSSSSSSYSSSSSDSGSSSSSSCDSGGGF